MIISATSIGSSSSGSVDFRELKLWEEARRLTLAVWDLLGEPDPTGTGTGAAENARSTCIAILTSIVETYDGGGGTGIAKLPSGLNEQLRRLETGLRGFVAEKDRTGPGFGEVLNEIEHFKTLVSQLEDS